MPNNNQIIPVQWNPRGGGLNTDISLKSIKDGDMPDAKNVRTVGKGLSVSPEYEPIVGNHYENTPDTIAVQDQQVLITIECGEVGAITYPKDYFFYRPNGSEIATGPFNIEGNDFALTVANIIIEFDATLLPLGYSYTLVTTTTSVHSGTLLLTIVDLPGLAGPTGWSWTFDVVTYITLGLGTVATDVVQEGYDTTLLGNWHDLGSFDLLTDTFIMWTTQKYLSVSHDIITDVIDDGTGLVQLEVSDSTGFLIGQSIRVSGVTGTNALDVATNGIWIIAFVDATHITLAASVFPGGAVYASGGLIFDNVYGMGQIGVQVEDLNTDTISYTTLLKSKEFNFRRPKQIDVYGDLKTSKKSLYYNDDLNPPRCFYYTGAYTTDGALKVNNSENIYIYGNIADQSRLIFAQNNAHLAYKSQTQSGGNLVACNSIYFFRFLTGTYGATEWSEPTDPISTFRASTFGDALKLCGDAEGTLTGKINILELTNIPVGVYVYVELAVVQFIGNAINSQIVRRDVLNGTDTQQLQHTGFESGTVDLDVGTLLFKPLSIASARNNYALENRLVLSDLQLTAPYDFTDFCLTVRHSIERITITGVGNEKGVAPDYVSEYQLGEYFEPGNVNSRVGYMLNDCYRIGFKFKIKSEYGGGITRPFWVDDILIDNNNFNINAAYADNRRDTSATFDNTQAYDLTDINSNPYVYYLTFQGFSLDFLIGDVPFRDLVESIIVMRAKRIPEVLASGFVVPAINGFIDGLEPTLFPASLFYAGLPGPDGTMYGEFPFITGHTFDGFNSYTNGFTPDNPTYAVAASGAVHYLTAQRRYGSFYWPDNFLGGQEIDFLPSDALLVFGSPNHSIHYPTLNSPATVYDNQYLIYDGVTGILTRPADNVILEGKFMINAVKPVSLGGQLYSKNLQITLTADFRSWTQPPSIILNTTSDIDTTTANDDYGFYIAQYYRALSVYDANYTPDTSKYGNRSTTEYITTDAFLDIENTLPTTILAGSLDIFSGDVFTQKTFFKHRYSFEDRIGLTKDLGFAGGVALYSQNTHNTQMRFSVDSTIDVYPGNAAGTAAGSTPLSQWLQPPGNRQAISDAALNYNISYDLNYGVSTERAFDTLLPFDTDLSSTLIYSELKPDGSVQDLYRLFLPLNIKYLAASDGSITHHTEANGELLTIQQRRFLRLYFNTNAVLTTQEGSEVITGSGAVLQRKGQTLSTFGSRHKWSFVKGKSKGGHDVCYYFDAENKIMMRIGYDGSVPISIEQGMHAWFDDNSTWVYNYDTPADDYGICSFWNQQYLEAGWTFRGKRRLEEWDDATNYISRTSVNLADNTVFSTFEEFDTIYTLTGTATIGLRPDDDPDNWTRESVDDNAFYNFYTIVWSELKDKFQAYHTYRPRIYNKMKDFICSPRPVGDTGKWYKHDKGLICTWYEDGTTRQTENGYIVPVVNIPANGVKTFLSQQHDTDRIVYAAQWTTNGQTTSAVEADMLYLEGKNEVKIFNDATVTLNPKADGGQMWGDYLTSKIVFQAGVYQKFSSMITRLYVRATNWMGRN